MTESFPALVAIDIVDERWPTEIADIEAKATVAVRAAYVSAADAELLGHRGVEVSLLLAGDSELRTLNNDYRDKDQPTNVLSFPAIAAGDPPPPPGMPLLLGDIAVSYDTARAEANDENKTLEDHFCHLVVHGMLHLLGFDHQGDEQAVEMERLEIAVLAELGIADPYEDASDA